MCFSIYSNGKEFVNFQLKKKKCQNDICKTSRDLFDISKIKKETRHITVHRWQGQHQSFQTQILLPKTKPTLTSLSICPFLLCKHFNYNSPTLLYTQTHTLLLKLLLHFYLIIKKNIKDHSLTHSTQKKKKTEKMLDPANEMLPPPSSSPTISSVSSSDLDTEVL